jgi:hypothetical protein
MAPARPVALSFTPKTTVPPSTVGHANCSLNDQLQGVLLATVFPLLEVKILVFQFVGWFAVQFIKKQTDIVEAAHEI